MQENHYLRNEKAKHLVSKQGTIQETLSDIQDLFFEILKPDELRFTFRVRLAKTFGSSFV